MSPLYFQVVSIFFRLPYVLISVFYFFYTAERTLSPPATVLKCRGLGYGKPLQIVSIKSGHSSRHSPQHHCCKAAKGTPRIQDPTVKPDPC